MYNEETFQPLDNLVLVKLDPISNVSEAGIIMSPTGPVNGTEMTGTVIRTGRGYNTITGTIPCNVKEKDRVLIRKGFGNKLESLGEDYLIIKDANIMGIILPKKKLIRIEKVVEKKSDSSPEVAKKKK